MRVLFLGANVASQMAITVKALRSIGVSAEGLTYGGSHLHGNDAIRVIAPGPRPRFGAERWRRSWSFNVCRAITAADVVHWNYVLPSWAIPGVSPAADVRLAQLLRRPGVVEAWGSDMRISEIAAADNPYYARREQYEYEAAETRAGSYARQEAFARRGVTTLLGPPWFEPYLAPGVFEEFVPSLARLFPADFTPAPPAVARRRPVIVHAPTASNAKGTTAVLAAIEALRPRFEFDFVLLEGMPREQLMNVLRDCDLLLDQFVLGEYGMITLEAMAFAKPVVCYLRPAVLARSPGRMPIISATPDDLTDVVAGLLADPERRRSVGEASRRYIEDYHDATKHAAGLVRLYERLQRRGRAA